MEADQSIKEAISLTELFILGELTGSPMHGYLLHTILNGIIGPTRKISWGCCIRLFIAWLQMG